MLEELDSGHEAVMSLVCFDGEPLSLDAGESFPIRSIDFSSPETLEHFTAIMLKVKPAPG